MISFHHGIAFRILIYYSLNGISSDLLIKVLFLMSIFSLCFSFMFRRLFLPKRTEKIETAEKNFLYDLDEKKTCLLFMIYPKSNVVFS